MAGRTTVAKGVLARRATRSQRLYSLRLFRFLLLLFCARARRYLSFIGSGFRTYSWRLIGGWVRVQNNSFETICFGRPRVAIHRSSALGSASTVGGSSVAGFLYIIKFPRNFLGRFKCQPRDYCTVKCPRCRPRLLLRNEPGRLAGPRFKGCAREEMRCARCDV